jgi:hypothetical protein
MPRALGRHPRPSITERKEIAMLKPYDPHTTHELRRATSAVCRLMKQHGLLELNIKQVARGQVEVRGRAHGASMVVLTTLTPPRPDLMDDCA